MISRDPQGTAGSEPRTLEVGDLAPDFELRGPAGTFVTLSEYRRSNNPKNVILVFFPLAFSPVCSTQLPEIARQSGRFEAADTVVLGISVDNHWANEAFARRLGIDIPLLSDFQRETSRAYGVLDDERGHSRRAVFAIDTQGRVVFKDVSPALPEDPRQLPSHERALEVLRGST